MKSHHFLWIAVGLAIWTVIVIAWITGPHDCTAPIRKTGHISCQH